MSAPLSVQLCRIAAPERLPDRHVASGVFGPADRTLGTNTFLVYLFEVSQPWLPSSQLLPSLSTTLEAEYAKLTDPNAKGSIDDRFELLLRAINQQLNAISESGETDWIGNLNGMLVVLTGNELHFSQTGHCPAYLLQNNRIRQITDEPNTAPDTHPLKTFANLASGQLIDGDQILIANHELYREISLDALRRLMGSASPSESASAIARELKREKNMNVSAVIMRFLEKPSPQSGPEVIDLEEEMQSSLKKVAKKLAPVFKRAKEVSAAASATASEKAKSAWSETIAPAAQKLIEQGKQTLSSDDEKTTSETEIDTEPVTAVVAEDSPVVEIIPSRKKREKLQQQAIAEAAEARLSQEEDEDESIIPLAERELEEPASEKPAFLASAITAISPLLTRMQRWLRIPKNRKLAALVAGVLILLITVWIGVVASHRSGSPAAIASNAALLKDVTDLKTKIDGEVTSKQTVQASQDIETALNKLATIKDPSNSEQDKATTLWAAITSTADTLNGTYRFTTAAATYQLSTGAHGFITSLPYFFAWEPTASSIYRTGRGDATQVQQSLALPISTDGVVSGTKSSEQDVAGYLLTKQGAVLRITDKASGQAVSAATTVGSDTFVVGDVIASYGSNIYILDGKGGLVWRYALSAGQFGKGTSVIPNKYDIKNAVSLAIDGAIYILKSDGSLLKFTSGKQDTNFQLHNIPLPGSTLIHPASVTTNETFPSIYLLDLGTSSSPWSSARVLEFAKNGSFTRQYAFPKELTHIRAVDVNPKDKTLWVLNDQTIYEFALP